MSTHFSMEYQTGTGKDWTKRSAIVVEQPRRRKWRYMLLTTTIGTNHEPRMFSDFAEAVAAAMAFCYGER